MNNQSRNPLFGIYIIVNICLLYTSDAADE